MRRLRFFPISIHEILSGKWPQRAKNGAQRPRHLADCRSAPTVYSIKTSEPNHAVGQVCKGSPYAGLQRRDAEQGTVANAFACDLGKPSLNLIGCEALAGVAQIGPKSKRRRDWPGNRPWASGVVVRPQSSSIGQRGCLRPLMLKCVASRGCSCGIASTNESVRVRA